MEREGWKNLSIASFVIMAFFYILSIFSKDDYPIVYFLSLIIAFIFSITYIVSYFAML